MNQDKALPHSIDIRERSIPLPSAQESYAKVLLTGTTGSGKTTLLRHLIGCNHSKDRFPSTSTARTTTAEIEIITKEDDFCAVVTFMPEDQVRAHIRECIERSCLDVIEDKSDEDVMDSLLSHREQRFRLSYILGSWDSENEEDSDNEEDDDNDEFDDIANDEQVGRNEAAENRDRLKTYRTRIRKITCETRQYVTEQLGEFQSIDTFEKQKRADWLSEFENLLEKCVGFDELIHEIMKAVEKRFDFINKGEFQREKTGLRWPISWHYTSHSREQFLEQLRWFSSNHYKQFGKLLTPLVNGMRVSGPFFPRIESMQVAPKLVLIDGEGIGHVAKSAYSISTRITRRFADVDLILIVDNAEQPMQAAPLKLLRSIGSSGNARKLAIAFTHFDCVKGDNLPTHRSKHRHVLKSVQGAISALEQDIGDSVAAELKEQIERHAFCLGKLHREMSKIPDKYRDEIRRLLLLMQDATPKDVPPSDNTAPIYLSDKVSEIKTALQNAIKEFLNLWRARLGKIQMDEIRKEHWTRIKALSRRFTPGWEENEYDDLQPIADLVSLLQEHISKWLDSPSRWTRTPNSKDEKSDVLNRIRSCIFDDLRNLAKEQIAELQRDKWEEAFGYYGRGSSYERADMLDNIYTCACDNSLEQSFQIVRKAVEKARGQLISLE